MKLNLALNIYPKGRCRLQKKKLGYSCKMCSCLLMNQYNLGFAPHEFAYLHSASLPTTAPAYRHASEAVARDVSRALLTEMKPPKVQPTLIRCSPGWRLGSRGPSAFANKAMEPR